MHLHRGVDMQYDVLYAHVLLKAERKLCKKPTKTENPSWGHPKSGSIPRLPNFFCMG